MPAPEFDTIVASVIAKSPFQRKKLVQYLAGRDRLFFERAEEFARDYTGYLRSQGIPLDYAVTAYLDLCKTMMKCQIEFMKTGVYCITDHEQAFDETYANPDRMKSYMIGLALSQFLWPTHYRIFDAFDRTLGGCRQGVGSYLEIGPGHGLYLHRSIRLLGPGTRFQALDISPTSVEITRSIIAHFHPELTGVTFRVGDFLQFDDTERYDFITMGEVLEHVNEPLRMLSKLESLLADSGRAFVTTAINAPAVDHVYHFTGVEQVRAMIGAAGLEIVCDEVLPVEELPMEQIVSQKITINYCAEVRKGQQ